ncbi:hypothetical protein C7388_101198 [Methylobacterium radiotolerans]|jgi:hypothetical protein|nr:hypothetical protein C7388_101198 [Methylobacterium organophilum]
MLLSRCERRGRTIHADAKRCPCCHAAAGAETRPAPSEAGYWICMLTTSCAVLCRLLVIRG